MCHRESKKTLATGGDLDVLLTGQVRCRGGERKGERVEMGRGKCIRAV